jgi:hypothetical protein
MMGLCTVVMASACFLCGMAVAAVDTETLGNIDMVSINKMQVTETENAYVLEVEITFQNKNPDAVKLRNGVFQTLIETKEKGQDAKIDIGNTTMDEVEVPGAANKKTPGTVTKQTRVMLGPKNDATVAKLLRLWNVMGNPAAPMVMVLKGTAEVGVKLPKGWVFEQGNTYEMELRFLPTVQRKVLFM